MRYVVYGAGAVGGVVGGLLHRSGRDVVLIARGAHLQAIRQDGLRLASPEGQFTARTAAVERPSDVEWRDGDIVLLSVKSDATTSAAQALAAAAPADLPVVSMQNGVANEPTLLRWFSSVYGICVMAPTAHLEPGLVEAHCHPTPAILDTGRYPSGIDEVAAQVAADFESAGMVSVPRDDIMRWKYRKLLMNLGNAVQAVCRPDDDRQALLDLIRAEAEQVLAAAGIDPVTEAADRERRGNILQIGEIPERPRSGGSTWQSLARRTGTIETDYLNGEIVRLGREQGLSATANELIRQAAVRHARNRLPPSTLPTRSLLDQL